MMRRCWRRLLLAFAVCAALGVRGAPASADDGGRAVMDLALATALDFRTAAIIDPATAERILADMPRPKGALEDTDTRRAMWSAFFATTIVRVGHLRSPTPLAAYYSPIYDVAVFSVWRFEPDGRFRIAAIRALPGEAIGRDAAADAAGPLPAWLAAEDQSLATVSRDRLDAIARLYPVEARGVISPKPVDARRERAQLVAEGRIAALLAATIEAAGADDLIAAVDRLRTGEGPPLVAQMPEPLRRRLEVMLALREDDRAMTILGWPQRGRDLIAVQWRHADERWSIERMTAQPIAMRGQGDQP